ncbi:MAG TPA: M50 family metallopeptidase [Streptosporangiaceae bacterium]|nr:M50 family metallopeptidase [Streptosporangiaceae bacterium]
MTGSKIAASLARIGQVQGHLTGPVSVLLALVAVGATAIDEIWLIARYLTTMAHEGAHATLASAIGNRIDSIELMRRDAAGVTHTSGKAGALGNFSVAFIGYLGPSAFGIGAAELIRIGHIVAVLWISVLGLIAILVSLRKFFSFVVVMAVLVLLFLVTGFAAVGVQVLTAYAIAWFLLVSSVRGVRRRRTGSADSDLLRGMTRVPHGFWYRVWLGGSVIALVFGATQLV